ncbi:RNA methyltransferase, TrmH family [Geodermatophilus dictyosporus]|uniref:RNA methyltransferase, TrmH family n=1 Tax=Geodermatophilus dictyosporus TaxID=1523247 RepID=A0A1I5Q5N1_9ACTN|nr:RNA methyltransferase [Geodermatophilus dictyosporus]SFP41487.1 RNA methyltransferase, TrmH family [Geodermatophilus dictyosporus]
MTEPLTERSGRVAAARKLTRRSGRDAAGAFLAEGRQAVSEALATVPEDVREVFATEAAAAAHRDLLAGTTVPVRLVTEKAAAALSETVTPQGLVAVCALRDVPADDMVAAPPSFAVGLAGLADPGNAGTVLRTADACGAGAVVFGAGSADPYGGKAVRSSAGSLFHVDVVRSAPLGPLVAAVQQRGVTVLAADSGGEATLDELGAVLAGPVLWLFGNEARGVPPELAAAADARVRIPMRGRAESLNLAAAAAICLYTTQRAQG